MIFTGRMMYLTAVTLQEYSEELSKELLRLGLVHFVDVRTIDPIFRDESTISVQREKSEARQTELTAARKRIESILNIGRFPRPTVGDDEIDSDVPTDKDDSDRMAKSLEFRIEKIRESQRNFQQKITRLEDVRRHMSSAGGISQSGGFLHFHTGSIPPDRLESLEQSISLYPAVLSRIGEVDQLCSVVIVGMKRNKGDLEKILKDHGFNTQDIPATSTKETIRDLDTKLAGLKEEQREYAESVQKLVGESRTDLDRIWRNLRVQELQRTIESHFAETKRAIVASGWLPESTKRDVQTALVRITEGHISLEWHKATEFLGKEEKASESKDSPEGRPRVKIPSRLTNPGFLNPFQRLVTNYGIPAYGTVDPTILVALAYIVMFGLMFGDAGHGLVLILTGLAGQLWTRKRKGPTLPSSGLVSSIPFLSRLMLWCGSAAVVAGILFGSYFGVSLLPPIWFNYHGIVAGHIEAGPVQSIFDILRITIYFGITVIGLGILINWVNLARQKRWLSLIFDNTGVLGGIIYAVGIIIASHFASSGFRNLPDNPLLIWIVMACVLILFFKMPLKERGWNPMSWLMEWMISLLEIFSGYLANTLSFMRVAGLGIAHVMLMIAFFQIAKMVSPEGFNLWAILIMILGNALVIVLEGLSAGIQSLRLNYYEFFSKHFQPSGVEYQPISLEEI